MVKPMGSSDYQRRSRMLNQPSSTYTMAGTGAVKAPTGSADPQIRRSTQPAGQTSATWQTRSSRPPEERSYYQGAGLWRGSQPPPAQRTVEQQQQYEAHRARRAGVGFGQTQPASAPPTQPTQSGGTGTTSSGLAPSGGGGAQSNYGTTTSGLEDRGGRRDSQQGQQGPSTPTTLGSLGVDTSNPAFYGTLQDELRKAGYTLTDHGNVYIGNQLIGPWDNPNTWAQGNLAGVYRRVGERLGGFPASTPTSNAVSTAAAAGQNINDLYNTYGLGTPPSLDQAAVERLNEDARRRYGAEQGRTIQALAEGGARVGAGADQLTGNIGDVSSQYGRASASEQARNQMQAAVSNLEAQRDFYQRRWAVAMMMVSNAQSVEEREDAQAHALEAIQAGANAQQELAKLQNQMSNEITWKDILGAGLGAATQIGSAYVGGRASSGQPIFGGGSGGGPQIGGYPGGGYIGGGGGPYQPRYQPGQLNAGFGGPGNIFAFNL